MKDHYGSIQRSSDQPVNGRRAGSIVSLSAAFSNEYRFPEPSGNADIIGDATNVLYNRADERPPTEDVGKIRRTPGSISMSMGNMKNKMGSLFRNSRGQMIGSTKENVRPRYVSEIDIADDDLRDEGSLHGGSFTRNQEMELPSFGQQYGQPQNGYQRVSNNSQRNNMGTRQSAPGVSPLVAWHSNSAIYGPGSTAKYPRSSPKQPSFNSNQAGPAGFNPTPTRANFNSTPNHPTFTPNPRGSPGNHVSLRGGTKMVSISKKEGQQHVEIDFDSEASSIAHDDDGGGGPHGGHSLAHYDAHKEKHHKPHQRHLIVQSKGAHHDDSRSYDLDYMKSEFMRDPNTRAEMLHKLQNNVAIADTELQQTRLEQAKAMRQSVQNLNSSGLYGGPTTATSGLTPSSLTAYTTPQLNPETTHSTPQVMASNYSPISAAPDSSQAAFFDPHARRRHLAKHPHHAKYAKDSPGGHGHKHGHKHGELDKADLWEIGGGGPYGGKDLSMYSVTSAGYTVDHPGSPMVNDIYSSKKSSSPGSALSSAMKYSGRGKSTAASPMVDPSWWHDSAITGQLTKIARKFYLLHHAPPIIQQWKTLRVKSRGKTGRTKTLINALVRGISGSLRRVLAIWHGEYHQMTLARKKKALCKVLKSKALHELALYLRAKQLFHKTFLAFKVIGDDPSAYTDSDESESTIQGIMDTQHEKFPELEKAKAELMHEGDHQAVHDDGFFIDHHGQRNSRRHRDSRRWPSQRERLTNRNDLLDSDDSVGDLLINGKHAASNSAATEYVSDIDKEILLGSPQKEKPHPFAENLDIASVLACAANTMATESVQMFKFSGTDTGPANQSKARKSTNKNQTNVKRNIRDAEGNLTVLASLSPDHNDTLQQPKSPSPSLTARRSRKVSAGKAVLSTAMGLVVRSESLTPRVGKDGKIDLDSIRGNPNIPGHHLRHATSKELRVETKESEGSSRVQEQLKLAPDERRARNRERKHLKRLHRRRQAHTRRTDEEKHRKHSKGHHVGGIEHSILDTDKIRKMVSRKAFQRWRYSTIMSLEADEWRHARRLEAICRLVRNKALSELATTKYYGTLEAKGLKGFRMNRTLPLSDDDDSTDKFRKHHNEMLLQGIRIPPPRLGKVKSVLKKSWLRWRTGVELHLLNIVKPLSVPGYGSMPQCMANYHPGGPNSPGNLLTPGPFNEDRELKSVFQMKQDLLKTRDEVLESIKNSMAPKSIDEKIEAAAKTAPARDKQQYLKDMNRAKGIDPTASQGRFDISKRGVGVSARTHPLSEWVAKSPDLNTAGRDGKHSATEGKADVAPGSTTLSLDGKTETGGTKLNGANAAANTNTNTTGDAAPFDPHNDDEPFPELFMLNRMFPNDFWAERPYMFHEKEETPHAKHGLKHFHKHHKHEEGKKNKERSQKYLNNDYIDVYREHVRQSEGRSPFFPHPSHPPAFAMQDDDLQSLTKKDDEFAKAIQERTELHRKMTVSPKVIDRYLDNSPQRFERISFVKSPLERDRVDTSLRKSGGFAGALDGSATSSTTLANKPGLSTKLATYEALSLLNDAHEGISIMRQSSSFLEAGGNVQVGGGQDGAEASISGATSGGEGISGSGMPGGLPSGRTPPSYMQPLGRSQFPSNSSASGGRLSKPKFTSVAQPGHDDPLEPHSMRHPNFYNDETDEEIPTTVGFAQRNSEVADRIAELNAMYGTRDPNKKDGWEDSDGARGGEEIDPWQDNTGMGKAKRAAETVAKSPTLLVRKPVQIAANAVIKSPKMLAAAAVKSPKMLASALLKSPRMVANAAARSPQAVMRSPAILWQKAKGIKDRIRAVKGDKSSSPERKSPKGDIAIGKNQSSTDKLGLHVKKNFNPVSRLSDTFGLIGKLGRRDSKGPGFTSTNRYAFNEDDDDESPANMAGSKQSPNNKESRRQLASSVANGNSPRSSSARSPNGGPARETIRESPGIGSPPRTSLAMGRYGSNTRPTPQLMGGFRNSYSSVN